MAGLTTIVRALVTADVSKMQTELKKAEGSLTKFGNKATAAGKVLTKKVTLPLVAVGGVSIKAASDFEASMKKIESLVGLSSEAVQGFEEDVKRLSGQTAQAPNDLADAMFFITSAGLRGAVATETLEASAKAAAVGLGETATIAELATSALNAYGAENLSASQATDVMVAAVREGKLEASELAGSMGRVLPLASAMGVNFNEVGAAFAAVSRTGTNAAEAATQVRGILAALLRPTKQSEEALTSMGMSSAELRAWQESSTSGNASSYLKFMINPNGSMLEAYKINSRGNVIFPSHSYWFNDDAETPGEGAWRIQLKGGSGAGGSNPPSEMGYLLIDADGGHNSATMNYGIKCYDAYQNVSGHVCAGYFSTKHKWSSHSKLCGLVGRAVNRAPSSA